MSKPCLYGFDVNSHFARVYTRLAPKGNEPVGPGAWLGDTPVFCLKPLLAMIEREMRVVSAHSPNSHLVLVFDHEGDNFRHRIYDDYKIDRPEKPESWVVQERLMYEMFQSLGFPCLKIPDVESDDVLATLAYKLTQHQVNMVIFTGDKDIMSCCNQYVSVYAGRIKRYLTVNDVTNKFGLPPEKILDYLALVGDAVDSVPGVSGIGDKSASQLLRHHSLQDLLEQPSIALDASIRYPKKVQKALSEQKTVAELSRQLVALKTDVKLGMNLSEMIRKPPNYDGFLDGYMRPSF